MKIPECIEEGEENILIKIKEYEIMIKENKFLLFFLLLSPILFDSNLFNILLFHLFCFFAYFPAYYPIILFYFIFL